jgi:hypothetical protein
MATKKLDNGVLARRQAGLGWKYKYQDMAIKRSEGERAECSSSLVYDKLHVNDELRLGLFGQRRMKQGLALVFQRDERGCEGDVGASECGDPDLPPGIPVMHTIHDPRKTIVNPHNRVGISDYNIKYITSLKVLHRPLGRIQMPHRACSTDTLIQ